MPKADPIVNASKVRLVDDNYSTEKRERVAEYILQHWNQTPDITLTEIANATGTSRQHVKNVLDDHFEAVNTESKMNDDRTRQPAIPARDGVDPELLKRVLQAYRIGVRDGAADDVEPGMTDELVQLAMPEDNR